MSNNKMVLAIVAASFVGQEGVFPLCSADKFDASNFEGSAADVIDVSKDRVYPSIEEIGKLSKKQVVSKLNEFYGDDYDDSATLDVQKAALKVLAIAIDGDDEKAPMPGIKYHAEILGLTGKPAQLASDVIEGIKEYCGGEKAEEEGSEEDAEEGSVPTADDIKGMKKAELKEMIEEYSIDIDPSDYPKVADLRKALIDMLEDGEEEEGEDSEEGNEEEGESEEDGDVELSMDSIENATVKGLIAEESRLEVAGAAISEMDEDDAQQCQEGFEAYVEALKAASENEEIDEEFREGYGEMLSFFGDEDVDVAVRIGAFLAMQVVDEEIVEAGTPYMLDETPMMDGLVLVPLTDDTGDKVVVVDDNEITVPEEYGDDDEVVIYTAPHQTNLVAFDGENFLECSPAPVKKKTKSKGGFGKKKAGFGKKK